MCIYSMKSAQFPVNIGLNYTIPFWMGLFRIAGVLPGFCVVNKRCRYTHSCVIVSLAAALLGWLCFQKNKGSLTR